MKRLLSLPAMRGLGSAAVLALLPLVALALQIPTGAPPPPPPAPSSQDDVIKLETGLVLVSFTAVDKSGRPVPDLIPKEITVLEDKKPQKIEYFHSGLLNPGQSAPTLILVLLSQSTSVSSLLQKDAEAAGKFIDALPRSAKVAVASFGTNTILRQGFTRDRQALINAFLNSTRTPGSSNLFLAVANGVDYLNRMPPMVPGVPNRKILIVVSDGIDSDRSTTVDNAVALASASSVTIHTVQMRSSLADSSNLSAEHKSTAGTEAGGGDDSFQDPELRAESRRGAFSSSVPSTLTSQQSLSIGRFRRLSGDTGGTHFTEARTGTGLSKILEEITDDVRNEYVIGYQPEDTNFDGQFRKIEIRVNRKGVKLEGARKGYVAAKEVKLEPVRRRK